MQPRATTRRSRSLRAGGWAPIVALAMLLPARGARAEQFGAALAGAFLAGPGVVTSLIVTPLNVRTLVRGCQEPGARAPIAGIVAGLATVVGAGLIATGDWKPEPRLFLSLPPAAVGIAALVTGIVARTRPIRHRRAGPVLVPAPLAGGGGELGYGLVLAWSD